MKIIVQEKANRDGDAAKLPSLNVNTHNFLLIRHLMAQKNFGKTVNLYVKRIKQS